MLVRQFLVIKRCMIVRKNRTINIYVLNYREMILLP